jgi:3-oxoacyl-[acyl-carrier-protein] synthase II
MADVGHAAWITGIGLVSCLGEGPEAHWAKLCEAKPEADSTRFAPYIVHPAPAINFDTQIPKKGDQRQMELWQRLGTYSAGLALDSAGVKGNTDILSRMDMIVAAGGGERDLAVDCSVLAGLMGVNEPGYLNERLMNDLRPTLFLAQLSNLLAGNISIVHGVTGSSRTFMGEESAGVDSVRIALARIAAGQSEIALVGGSHNGERKDLLMLYEFADYNLKDRFAPVWERGPRGGFALGSIGAFLVLEAPNHATARGARPFATITAVLSDSVKRTPGSITASLSAMWQRLAGEHDLTQSAIISGATGTEPATSEEREYLAAHADIPARATGTYVGHGMEPQFPFNIAVAALAVKHGRLFPPGDTSGVEREMDGPLARAVVTGVGHLRGEGMALVEPAP